MISVYEAKKFDLSNIKTIKCELTERLSKIESVFEPFLPCAWSNMHRLTP